MLSYDIIKIHLSDEGYLPDYPPHLISDEEMCEAFLQRPTNTREDENFLEFQYFNDYYPLVAESLQNEYDSLKLGIRYHFARFVTSVKSFKQELPDWVQSYMLDAVVSVNSSQQDRHWMLTNLQCDNIDDVITEECQEKICRISKILGQNEDNAIRHVKIDNFSHSIVFGYSESEISKIEEELDSWGVLDALTSENGLDSRPPFMFGELSLIKYLRIRENRVV